MKPIFKPAFLLLITIALLSFIQFNSSFATDLASSTNNQINNSRTLNISEIKYDPNSVDVERFLFTMTDGNYVYITLERFEVVRHKAL